MTETVDVFYQQTNYVTLLIFWLLIDVRFLLLHASFIFDCLVYFFHYSVLHVRFYNKIKKVKKETSNLLATAINVTIIPYT